MIETQAVACGSHLPVDPHSPRPQWLQNMGSGSCVRVPPPCWGRCPWEPHLLLRQDVTADECPEAGHSCRADGCCSLPCMPLQTGDQDVFRHGVEVVVKLPEVLTRERSGESQGEGKPEAEGYGFPGGRSPAGVGWPPRAPAGLCWVQCTF